jgi:hypothetical protein
VVHAGFAQKVSGSCVFCAISRPLLSIAAAGSPVVGADPSSTTSSCPDDVELLEGLDEDEVDKEDEVEGEEVAEEVAEEEEGDDIEAELEVVVVVDGGVEEDEELKLVVAVVDFGSDA